MVDSTKIILKASDVPAKAPTINDIDLGEIAINTYDGDLFLKRDQDGEISIIRFTRDNPIENVIFVQKSGSDTNRGDSWDSAYLTIERAIEDAWTRDGSTVLIEIGPGVYTTKGHIDMPDNSIIKCTYRSVKIRPEPGYEERNVFRMGSGCFIEGPVFEGFRIDSFVDPSEGFAAVFRPGAIITRTPYVHKIAVRSIPTWTQIAPPLDRVNGNPLVPRGGGVVMADGNVISPYSIYPNLMTWGATPVIHNGVGYVAKNGALINAVNAISMWAHKHFYAINGGQIVLSGCSTQFGDYTLIAEGVRNVVNPYSLDSDLVANNAAGVEIYNAANTIIDGMWANLVSEGYTTDWPQTYEDRTMTDANLLMRSLSWTIQSGNEKPVRDFAKGFFDVQGDRVFIPQEYDYDKCFRDTGLISEAIAYDVAFGSNYRSINAAKSYHRANASAVVTTQLADTVSALTHQKAVVGSYLSGNTLFRSDNLFDEVIDIVTNGEASANSYVLPDPTSYDTGFEDARRLLMINKEFVQQEIDAWIKYQIDNDIAPFNRVSEHRYDQATCSRDVGLIIDSLGYDMMFGSNIRAITAGRSYYRQGAAVVTERQKVATVSAFQYLKTKLAEIVSSVPAAVSRIEAGMDIIISILELGLDSEPSLVAPIPSSGNTNSFDSGYLNARNNVESNRAFIKAETVSYLEAKYPAIEYDRTKCLRDVDYILDALFFDTTYGGNLETIIAGNAYFSGAVLQFAERERAPTIDVYEYLGDLVNSIATSSAVVPYQDVVTQTLGTAGSAQAGAFVKSLMDTIVETIRTEVSQPVVLPDTTWVASNLTTMFSTLQSSKSSVQTDVISYVNSFFDRFTYNRELCKRDVGLIIDAVGYDLMFNSNFRSITAGRSYYRSGASDVVGLQKTVTLAAIEHLKSLMVDVVDGISATAASRVTSNVNTIINIITNGISVVPSTIAGYTITTPTGGTGNAFNASYATVRNQIESYRAFLKTSTVSFINTNYPTVAATYNQALCERDIDYILNAMYYDLTYGGNLETVVAARSYYSNAVLQLGAGETAATVAAYNNLKSQLVLLATDAVDSAMGTIVGDIFQVIIDAIQTGTVEESAVELPDITWVSSELANSHTALQSAKTTTQTSVITYVDTQFVRLYDTALCARDVGLIVDAVAYDLMFGSNFRTITAGRSYYRAGAAVVTASQKVMTVAAVDHLKGVLFDLVNGTSTIAGQRINTNMDLLVDIIQNGTANLPASISGYVIPQPTGGINNAYTVGYANARDAIETNRSTLKASTISFIESNYPAIANTYNQATCERDIDYILNATYYDLTYGGNLESVVAAKSYYSNAVLQLGSGESTAAVAAYGYMRDQIGTIATAASNTFIGDSAKSLIQTIINVIDTGNTDITATPPNVIWVSGALIDSFNLLESNKDSIKTSVIDFVDGEFIYGYDVAKCRRDVGLIIDALRYDMTYGGNLETYNAASAYFVGTQAQYGSGEKLATIAALNRMSNVLGYVLQAELLPDVTPGGLIEQDISPPVGSLVAATFAQTRVGEIISTITSNGNLPLRILPSILWAETEYQNAFAIINIHKTDITVDVMEYISKQTKSLLGAFLNAYDYINTAISNLPGVDTYEASRVAAIINNIKNTIINPVKVEEPSLISAIGHTWTAIMSGVALTKIPTALNQATIQDSILELDKGSVIASGQDDQGSALFVGGLEINADTGELAGPPFQQAVNRISTRAAISRSF